jgi:hypothetical protein
LSPFDSQSCIPSNNEQTGSKCGALLRDGFKPTSLVKSKLDVRNKKDAKLNPSIGKNCQTLPTKVDFLDLTAIDKFMFLGLAYLEIPVAEIQKVAMDNYGVHPLEVTLELL